MKEEKKFQAESKQLLNLMINSIYSNKEVFLRELISNASDAIDKYKFMALQSEGKYPLRDYEIRITSKKEEGYLQVQDNGIGMDKEALEKNLGTIAKSGTKEFLEKYQEMKEKKEDVDLIGQFGVGFYSAFMVAKKIEVYTKDIQGKCYLFTSDGVETYTIEDLDEIDFIKEGGSAIRIYLKDDTEEECYSKYQDSDEIESLVKRYSDFIRYPIRMLVVKEVPEYDEQGKVIEGKTHEESEDKTLNSMIPLWKKSKKDVTEEELNSFYRSRFNDYEDPLLSINIKAEGTLSYNSLVFIPSHAPYDLYSQDYERGLALYAKGIFISEKNKDLIPDYLKFAKGLVDSEDLSLNISREMLQKSPILNKISKNIENKIIDRLKEVMNNDNDKYQKFFDLYGVFIKFGIYASYGMKKDALSDLLVYRSLNQEKKISLKQYKENMKEDQKVIYYATGKTKEAIEMLPELAKFKKNNIDVLFLSYNIDEFVFMMMHDYDSLEFKNITSEDKESLSEEEKKRLEDLEVANKRLLDDVKASLGEKVDAVSFNLHLGEAPVSLASKEGMSMNMANVLRKEQEARNEEGEGIEASKVLQINPDHPLFEAIKDVTAKEEVDTLASVLYDEAMILEGFEIDDKASFIKNLNALMLKAYQK